MWKYERKTVDEKAEENHSGSCGDQHSIVPRGGFITSSLGRVQKDTMTTQMISEAEEYKANVLRKIKMDQQTLQTLASFFRFSNTISMIDTDAFANGLYESNRHNSFIQMGYFTEDGDGIRVTVDREIKKMSVWKIWKRNCRRVSERRGRGERGVQSL